MAWSVKQHAAEIARKSTGELQKALAVHDFVAWTVELFSGGHFVAPRRVFEFIFLGSFSQVSRIPFGFTAAFDAATPAETVMYQRGHCNPKGRLFVSLCRELGLEAKQHWVNIDNQVLRGLGNFFPAVLTHSFAEVKVDGTWCKVDSYIVDGALEKQARIRLEREDLKMGYSLHRKGTIEWDGKSDAFSQMAEESMVLEDLGCMDWEEVRNHPKYMARLGPFNLTSLLRLPFLGSGFERTTNQMVRELQGAEA